jgi:hypothetical protein
MVGKPSKTETIAELLATVPGLCLGINLPIPARSSGDTQDTVNGKIEKGYLTISQLHCRILSDDTKAIQIE